MNTDFLTAETPGIESHKQIRIKSKIKTREGDLRQDHETFERHSDMNTDFLTAEAQRRREKIRHGLHGLTPIINRQDAKEFNRREVQKAEESKAVGNIQH
jgi:hypothetical protein